MPPVIPPATMPFRKVLEPPELDEPAAAAALFGDLFKLNLETFDENERIRV